jgi:RHS repeat-associated protein
VSLLTRQSDGTVRASYGYTPYGAPDATLNKGDTSLTTPFNPYQYSAKRLDSGSGTYDMGVRRYDPSAQRFLQLDQFQGALDDLTLAADPLTQNRYGLAASNPLSAIEWDGHVIVAPPSGGAAPRPTPASSTPPPPPSAQAAHPHPHPSPNPPPMPISCISEFCGDPLLNGLWGLTGIPNIQACGKGSALDCLLTAGMVLPPGKAVGAIRAFRATWEALKYTTRGFAFEGWIASKLDTSWERLAPGFKTFDFYRAASGWAMSAKSMDLSLKRYSTFKGITSRAQGWVREAADYDEIITRGGIRLDPARIQERIVKIVYPDMPLSRNHSGLKWVAV